MHCNKKAELEYSCSITTKKMLLMDLTVSSIIILSLDPGL